jgi:hypothetical protein
MRGDWIDNWTFQDGVVFLLLDKFVAKIWATAFKVTSKKLWPFCQAVKRDLHPKVSSEYSVTPHGSSFGSEGNLCGLTHCRAFQIVLKLDMYQFPNGTWHSFVPALSAYSQYHVHSVWSITQSGSTLKATLRVVRGKTGHFLEFLAFD